MAVGKSARVLGLEFGRSARDMNALLKEHGYLDGEPGAYAVTEKGASFAREEHHHRGPGGYSWYNRDWEVRTWADGTADALRADLEAGAAGPAGLSTGGPEDHTYLDPRHDDAGDQNEVPTLKELAIGVVALGAFVFVAPHAIRLWEKRVKPAAQSVRDRFTKHTSTEQAPARQQTPGSSGDTDVESEDGTVDETQGV